MTEQRTPAIDAGSLDGVVGDPDLAASISTALASGADPAAALDRVLPVLQAEPTIALDPTARRRLVAIAGSSRAMSRALARNPRLLLDDPGSSTIAVQAEHALVAVAGDDLSGVLDLPDAMEHISEAMDRIVEGALVQVRAEVGERHPVAESLPMAVIAMGKWGARELNYRSDLDFILVHDNLEEVDGESRAAALAMAARLIGVLSAPVPDGPGLEVDLDLRPEGAVGALSRTIESYTRYYQQWSEAWELQALLKARFAAGDSDLGARFTQLTEEVVWDRGLDVEALRAIRRIKEQVEQGAAPNDIKRSRGGIRDIEFSVQLLQLVHGRTEPDLRVPATLDALAALSEFGFVEAEDHDRLAAGYRFLRDLEHRIQLWDLRQTHELPPDAESRSRIGRSLGFEVEPERRLVEALEEVRAVVRDAHERLYFRPILDALVGSPSARLGVEEAALRLGSLGFADITGATRALEELTAGLSRRSRAMHQMLPLMLDWLSISPDPDLGLAQLRVVLANTTDHSALVTLLQVNPLAGERLCLLLGTSRLVGQLIDRIPEFVPRLADERLLGDIRPRDPEIERLISLLDSRPEPDAKVGTVRRFTRRRKLRIAARDILGEASVADTLRALSDSADAAVNGGLHIASEGDPSGFVVVAMGRWGGLELSYGSDLDVMHVFADEADRDRALHLAGNLSRVLSEPSRHGEAYVLDADIRPEGKNGPLARSLESYRRYYQDWVEPWEVLALVRARPVAGDPEVAAAFGDLVEDVLWQDEVPEGFVRSIREMKARVENERIPAGEDPDFHLKLGRGSLSDIEFLVQLLQLRHGHNRAELRLPGTLDALQALRTLELLSREEADTLAESYLFCTRVRLRLHLQAGRASDSLPTGSDDLARLASSLGFSRAAELREQYRRVTRRARQVFERRFYE